MGCVSLFNDWMGYATYTSAHFQYVSPYIMHYSPACDSPACVHSSNRIHVPPPIRRFSLIVSIHSHLYAPICICTFGWMVARKRSLYFPKHLSIIQRIWLARVTASNAINILLLIANSDLMMASGVRFTLHSLDALIFLYKMHTCAQPNDMMSSPVQVC